MIYRGTPEGSPMRRLLVDLHVKKGFKRWLTTATEPQFIFCVANTVYDKVEAHETIGYIRETALKAEDYL